MIQSREWERTLKSAEQLKRGVLRRLYLASAVPSRINFPDFRLRSGSKFTVSCCVLAPLLPLQKGKLPVKATLDLHVEAIPTFQSKGQSYWFHASSVCFVIIIWFVIQKRVFLYFIRQLFFSVIIHYQIMSSVSSVLPSFICYCT